MEKRASKSIAAKVGYCAIPDPDKSMSEDVERLLAQAESLAASIVTKKVLKQELLSAQQRAELAVSVGMMHSRVPGQIDHAGGYMAEVARRMLERSHEVSPNTGRSGRLFKERYRRDTGRNDLGEAKPEDLDPSHIGLLSWHG